MPRRFPIFQFPNPPLLAAMAAQAVARTANGETARGAAVVSDVALLVWSYEEVSHGANWFRRLLGLGGGAYALRMMSGRRSTPAGA
jgi:hypothetical protein